MHLFQYTVTHLVTASCPDNLLHMKVLQRQRIQVFIGPAFALDNEFAMPFSVSPGRVLVTQAFHPVYQYGFQVNFKVFTRTVVHGNHRGTCAPGSWQHIDLVVHLALPHARGGVVRARHIVH